MGIINAQGKLVTTLDYQRIKSAYNGYIIASKNDKYGLLNTKGKVIIPAVTAQVSSLVYTSKCRYENETLS